MMRVKRPHEIAPEFSPPTVIPRSNKRIKAIGSATKLTQKVKQQVDDDDDIIIDKLRADDTTTVNTPANSSTNVTINTKIESYTTNDKSPSGPQVAESKLPRDYNNSIETDMLLHGWSVGYLYGMGSPLDLLNRKYYGITTGTLSARNAEHIAASEHGDSKWYVAMRDIGSKSFWIKEVKRVPFPPGTSKAEKLKILRVLETQEIARHDRTTLFNTPHEEITTKRKTTMAKRTSEEKKHTVDRWRESRNHRGSMRQTPSCTWCFQWTIDGIARNKTYKTKKEAEYHRDLIYPQKTAVITPQAPRSFIYEAMSPHLTYNLKRYRGKTKMTLAERWFEHRRDTRIVNPDAFHKFVNDNQPLKWFLVPILTLYGVSDDDLLAIEAVEIDKIPLELRWNFVPEYITLNQRCYYNGNAYYFNKDATTEYIENEMAKIVTDGSDITKIKINKWWKVQLKFNKKEYNKSFSFNKHGGEVNSKMAAQAYLASLLAKRLAWQTVVANAAIQRSIALELEYAVI